MNSLFEIRGEPSKRVSTTLQVAGILFLVSLWWSISITGWISSSALPSPWKVLQTYPELHLKNAMVRNLLYSCYLNGVGYVEAIAVSLPLGFLIGMFPMFNLMFSKPVNSIRAIPLTALVGVFIEWFGLGDRMKIQFLAFGIIVYLLPVVVQRTREAPIVYQQTATTLGASRWKMFLTVFYPYVKSRIILDIQNLVAISWTYIIVAEMMNDTGGIGAMLYKNARMGRIDKATALLFVIVLVVTLQDKAFLLVDRVLNRHKYT
jgi:NitT/TauT family transport system permease protein